MSLPDWSGSAASSVIAERFRSVETLSSMRSSSLTPARAAALATLSLASVLVTGCSAPSTHPSASATGHPPEEASALTTGDPVTVIDDGSGAELCLGVVFQMLPPACDGPRVEYWEWSDQSGHHEEVSGVRWGEFVVTGSYDAETKTFTATEIVPGPDRPIEPVADESARVSASAGPGVADESELQAIFEDELAVRDDVLGWGVDPVAGEVTMQVVYDAHGGLQSEMDEKYGPGIVRVLSSLQPVD